MLQVELDGGAPGDLGSADVHKHTMHEKKEPQTEEITTSSLKQPLCFFLLPLASDFKHSALARLEQQNTHGSGRVERFFLTWEITAFEIILCVD